MSAARTAALLAAAQVALVALYLVVESERRPASTFRWEPRDEHAPPWSPARDGVALRPPVEAHLVHFWATWCGPCRTELPGLLETASREGIPLLAVTAEPWPVVERYFGGNIPDEVVHDPRAAGLWQVDRLPDTFVVREGRVVARVGGARDWATDDARAFLRATVTEPASSGPGPAR